MRLPGLINSHAHLRVPGGEHKEDFRTGSIAALAGGFTTVLAMPNTKPPLTRVDLWQEAQHKASTEALCDVHLMAGASGTDVEELFALSGRAVALKLYLDVTYGPLQVRGLRHLEAIFANWHAPKPICCHAEDESLAMVLGLAAAYSKPVHICHVARQSEIELIARAKREGLPVTCEVAPHHLFLTEKDAESLGAYGDMRPRLQSAKDVAALWQHINTTIDVIADDHAPHAIWEKEGFAYEADWQAAGSPCALHGRPAVDAPQNPNPVPPGIPGLESTLPLMLTAAAEERLSYDRLRQLLHDNPRRIFGLPEQPETWIEVDESARYRFPDHPLYTKCGWSPFEGWEMTGRVRRMVLRGREMYRDGQILPDINQS